MTVKGNQPQLLAQVQTKAQHQKLTGRFIDVEKTRGRITCRIVNVFTDLSSIELDWVGLKSLIQVERIGLRQGQSYQQTNYYISSLVTSALQFAQAIRSHWGIANRLHWGGSALGGFSDLWRLPFKDVIFGEDAAPFINHNAATTGVFNPYYRYQYRTGVWR